MNRLSFIESFVVDDGTESGVRINQFINLDDDSTSFSKDGSSKIAFMRVNSNGRVFDKDESYLGDFHLSYPINTWYFLPNTDKFPALSKVQFHTNDLLRCECLLFKKLVFLEHIDLK
jgi:hypothetical protein